LKGVYSLPKYIDTSIVSYFVSNVLIILTTHLHSILGHQKINLMGCVYRWK